MYTLLFICFLKYKKHVKSSYSYRQIFVKITLEKVLQIPTKRVKVEHRGRLVGLRNTPGRQV